jgi:hypothetical protein
MATASAHAKLVTRLWVFVPNFCANAAQLLNQTRLFTLAGVKQSQDAASKFRLQCPAKGQPDKALALMANE